LKDQNKNDKNMAIPKGFFKVLKLQMCPECRSSKWQITSPFPAGYLSHAATIWVNCKKCGRLEAFGWQMCKICKIHVFRLDKTKGWRQELG